MKIVEKIKLKIVIFTAVKNRCIFHGRVFVMCRYFRDKTQRKVSLPYSSLLSKSTITEGKPQREDPNPIEINFVTLLP